MTIFTDTPVRRSNLLEYQSPLGDVLAARAATAFDQGLTYIVRAGELVKAQEGDPKGLLGMSGRDEPDSPLLSADDARRKVTEAGVEVEIPEEGIRSRALDILLETKREQKVRDDVISRGPGGILAGALGVGASFAGAAADPLNVATAFIPVIGEARYAALLGRAGTTAGRAGVRLGVGAAEGAIGASAVEPFIAYAANQLQADYDLTDSLLNIGVGGVLGGGLHVGIGAASDALSRGLSWREAKAVDPLPAELSELDFQGRRTVLQSALSQALDGKAIDIEDVLAAQARRILAKEAPAPDFQRQPVNLSKFVAGLGGVSDFKGELASMDLDKVFVPGVGRLVREGGRPLDSIREVAAEAGYFDHIYGNADDAVSQSTVADLLNALGQDVRGERVYSGEDRLTINARADFEAAKAAREKLRQNLDQLSQEIETELPDEIVVDAARNMNDGMSPDDALERAIIRDYQVNGAPVPLERANGSRFEIPPGWDAPPVSRGRLAQRAAIERSRESSRPGRTGETGADGGASGDVGKAPREDAQAELAEAETALGRLGDALGVSDTISRNLADLDDLIDRAASYGRAMQAAASCQLRRGL